MDTDQSEKLALIREMHALACEVKRVTMGLVIKVVPEQEEADINAYATLIEKRAPLIHKLVDLKHKLGNMAISTDIDSDAPRALNTNEQQYHEERRAVEQLVKEILTLDRQQSKAIQQIKTRLKSSIRDINNAKKLNTIYARPMEEYKLLDAKQ